MSLMNISDSMNMYYSSTNFDSLSSNSSPTPPPIPPRIAINKNMVMIAFDQ